MGIEWAPARPERVDLKSKKKVAHDEFEALVEDEFGLSAFVGKSAVVARARGIERWLLLDVTVPLTRPSRCRE